MEYFLLTGFVKSVPRELDEAAFIDGCNVIKLFSILFSTDEAGGSYQCYYCYNVDLE